MKWGMFHCCKEDKEVTLSLILLHSYFLIPLNTSPKLLTIPVPAPNTKYTKPLPELNTNHFKH